jgi:hypothetical protein
MFENGTTVSPVERGAGAGAAGAAGAGVGLGAVGLILPASPPIRGGVIRLFAIALAIFGIGFSVLG